MAWFERLLRNKKGSSPHATGSAEGVEHLERAIGYVFKDKALLVIALRHRSYVWSNGEKTDPVATQANERLEFLGDAVVGLLATEHLYRRFPEEPEGELTKRKSVLVSKSALARCAVDVHLDEHLLLSSVEEGSGGRHRRSILGDGFEALAGAIFLDGGLDPVRILLERVLFVHLSDYETEAVFTNYKSLLLEHVQATGSRPPEYSLRNQSGPDHEKVFTVDVRIDGEVLGEGSGPTKKHAQQEAARKAYELLLANPKCPPELAAASRASSNDDQ